MQGKSPMSVKITSLVWDGGPIDRSQRLLMLALADSSNDDGFSWPGIQTLATKTATNARTVIRALKGLERHGWIAVNRKAHYGKGNTYQINTGKLGDKLSREIGDKLSREIGDKLSREIGDKL